MQFPFCLVSWRVNNFCQAACLSKCHFLCIFLEILKSPFMSHFSTLAQFVGAPHIEPIWWHWPGHGHGKILLLCKFLLDKSTYHYMRGQFLESLFKNISSQVAYKSSQPRNHQKISWKIQPVRLSQTQGGRDEEGQ